MKTKQMIATAAMLIATGAAFAQQTESVAPDANFVSTRTRAEVIAELKQAQANGVYAVGGEEFPGQVVANNARAQYGSVVAGGKTRAEVVAELQQAQVSGAYVAGGEEFPGQVARNTYSPASAVQSAGIKKPVSSGVSGN